MVCDVLSMLYNCNNVVATMVCNNVSVLCPHATVTGDVLLGEIACNKYPVLLLLLLLLLSYGTQDGISCSELRYESSRGLSPAVRP